MFTEELIEKRRKCLFLLSLWKKEIKFLRLLQHTDIAGKEMRQINIK